MNMKDEQKCQSAIVGDQNGGFVLSHSAPLPPEDLENDQVAVEVKAIALNPVDAKMIGNYHTPGAILGCELAGLVTATGSAAGVTFQAGDRVIAAIVCQNPPVFEFPYESREMGMNPLHPRVGAFAQHTIAPAHVVLRIPDALTFAEAAGIGNAWYTVPWALFYAMGLPPGPHMGPLISNLAPPVLGGPKIDFSTRKTVLVSGGSSSTGTCAIQLLKLAGFDVVATCSPRNFALAQSYGADAVFDYTSPTCAADIRAHTRNTLHLALDCITTPDSTRLCYGALSRAGGRYVALEPYSEVVVATRTIVKPSWVLGPELMGEDVVWPEPHRRKANPEAKKFCQEWNRALQKLLNEGLIRAHPLLVQNTGLFGALEGLETIRAKKVSGQKLVYVL